MDFDARAFFGGSDEVIFNTMKACLDTGSN